MNKKIKILSAIFLVILTTFFAGKIKDSVPVDVEEKRLSSEIYYVLATSFDSELENINKKDLAGKTVFVTEEDQENLKKILGSDVDIKIYREENLDLKINDLVALRWNKVEPNLKSLSYEGNHLWEKGDLGDYGLRVSIEIEEKEKEKYPNFSSENLVKVNFLGDIMLSRHVNTQMQKYGFDYPWQKVKSQIASSDITFANLEVPISDKVKSPATGMSFVAPTKNLKYIKDSGIDVVSVANNHSANFGYNIFLDNLANLGSANLGICGGGKNESEARAPYIIKIGDKKFAFLCQSAIVGTLYAKMNSAGSPYLGIEPWYRDDELSIKALEKDIKKAKELADVVVVSPHWGVEYVHKPNASQRKVAQRAIKAGADLVIGTHPHVVQGIEFFEGRYINYSLGNFIFDQEWSTATKQGVMVSSYFYDGKNVGNKMIPLQIENYSQPQFVNSKKAANEILRIIFKNSFGI